MEPTADAADGPTTSSAALAPPCDLGAWSHRDVRHHGSLRHRGWSADPAGACEADPIGIVASHLTKSFGVGSRLTRLAARAGRRAPIAALDDVSFGVEDGEIRALVGPNGSGKSTLLRVLATLVVPDGGSATVDGFDVARQDVEVRRRLAWVPADDRSFNLRLTGRENLRLFARLHGVDGVDDALDEVALTEAADGAYAGYSTGMRQRLAIARALLTRPQVLLLDEPFRALDAESSRRLREAVGRAAADGVTVVVATHHIDELGSLPTGVLSLESGRLVA